MKVAILLYLYHLDLWDEYKNLILNNCKNYTLFLGLCEENNNQHIIDDCKKNFSDYKIQIFKNKGVDIGPFLKQLEFLDEKEYPFFIKIHSKKSVFSGKSCFNWRIDLLNSLIGSEFTFDKNLEIIKNKDIGCVFNTCFLNRNQSVLTSKIKEVLDMLDLSYRDLSNSQYMMGSIYLSKTSVFKKYFTSKFISEIYNKLEDYGPIPDDGSYNHAMEVISGYIIKNEKLRIVDGVVKSKIIYNHNSKNNKIHLVHLYSGEYTTKENIKIKGLPKGDKKIFWVNANAEQEYQIISKNKLMKKENSNFDKMLYKILNKDIKINTLDAENHYINFGKEEGRITKEDIQKVFDASYYKNLYGIKKEKYQEIFQDYIIKGIPGFRLYNPIIVEDNFDYGFYQSYNKIFDNTNFNQYTALYDYILNKKKCNNKIVYNNTNKTAKFLCIYYCNINNIKDLYYLKTNIDILSQDFEKIVVIHSSEKIQFKNEDKIIYIKSSTNNKYQEYVKTLNNIDLQNYTSVCLIDDSNIIIKRLDNFLNRFLQTDCFLYSFTDCYIKSYHIDDSVILFDIKNIDKIKSYLIESKDKIDLSKNIIKDNYLIGSFFQINQEKELFWKNLFIDMKYFPSILVQNNIPFINKINIKYLLNLIPKNFKKTKTYKGKVQSFFNIQLNQDNIKNIFNIDILNKKFCVIIHITDFKKIDEYKSFIDYLKLKVNCEIYLTTNSRSKKGFIKNKGMDIGPFIKSINKIKKDYDYIIKLHSKNLRSFRNLCFNNIINNIYHHILLLESDDNLFCSGPNLYNIKLDNINNQKIKEFLLRNNIKLKEAKENNFFAGTMFIAKYKPMKDFIKTINPEEEYEILESGDVLNVDETNTHAWERILTNIIPNYYGMKNCSI